MSDYPAWICHDCGIKYGFTREGDLATFHKDICGWCGEERACTEPRDYRYPPLPPYEGASLLAALNGEDGSEGAPLLAALNGEDGSEGAPLLAALNGEDG